VAEYAILRREEAPDYTGDAPGAFLGYARPMGAQQLAVNVRVLAPHTGSAPPGSDPGWGHGHRTIEEIYLVMAGEIRIKLGDDVETLRQYDAVLIPADTVRAMRNDTGEEAVIAMISVKVEDNRAESVPQEGFWPRG
jgi:mannose-6-phosphate isomerase-like protein (cupin superfamily)